MRVAEVPDPNVGRWPGRGGSPARLPAWLSGPHRFMLGVHQAGRTKEEKG